MNPRLMAYTAAGTHRFFCTVRGHEQRGLQGTVVVQWRCGGGCAAAYPRAASTSVNAF